MPDKSAETHEPQMAEDGPGPDDPTADSSKDGKEGLVHITEGYYKYTDILFDWPKYMNIWHVS